MSGEGGSTTLGVLGKLGGRKFLMALIGVIAMALHNYFNLDTNTVLTVGGLIATYILGQSVSDGMTAGATSTTTPVVDPSDISKFDMVKAMAQAGHKSDEISAIVDKLTK